MVKTLSVSSRYHAVLLALVKIVCSQSSPLPTCLSSSPNQYCVTAQNILQKCSALTASDIIACYCTQTSLTDLYGCKGEYAQCGLGTQFDSDIDTTIANWHDACDAPLSSLSSTVIVPNPSLLAATPLITQRSAQDCQAAVDACNSVVTGIQACETLNAPADITSCACGASLLALDSSCYYGAASCASTPVASSKLLSNVFSCDATVSPTATALTGPSATASVPSTSPAVNAPAPASVTPLPPPQTQSTTVVPTSSTSAGQKGEIQLGLHSLLAVILSLVLGTIAL